MKLTLNKAVEAVERIKKESYDNEVAHQIEDDLMKNFIRCCSEGLYSFEDILKISKVIIKSEEVDFERWYS